MLTRLLMSWGRWKRSCLTVWNTSTSCSSFNRSHIQLTLTNSPLCVTPSLLAYINIHYVTLDTLLRPCSHTSTYITLHWTHYFVLARIHQHILRYTGHIISSLLAYINIHYITLDTLLPLCSHTSTYITLHWTHDFISVHIHQHTLHYIRHTTWSHIHQHTLHYIRHTTWSHIHQHTLHYIRHITLTLLAYVNIQYITPDTLLHLCSHTSTYIMSHRTHDFISARIH